MSARANSARNAFHRSLNPWLRPHPSGPINKNQQPKRKTGINTTLDRFHKLIVDLNKQNAKLIEIIENMEKIQSENTSSEEEDILDQKSKEEEKKRLINEFQATLSEHRKSLENRLKKLNEIEESLSIFRFDEPQPQPPKVEFPPVNPNIPSPRAHLRTSPRFDLANSITKAENNQLAAKALYLERMIIVQKMKLKLCHDHRELSKLTKELSDVQSSNQNERTDFQAIEPLSNSGRSSKSPRARMLKNNIQNLENSSNIASELEREEESDEEHVSHPLENGNEQNFSNNESTNIENQNEINNNNDDNDDDDSNGYEEIEDQKLKDSITFLKAAIEHEKLRIMKYKSKNYWFYEAAIKIQKVWRGYSYRLANKKQEKANES